MRVTPPPALKSGKETKGVSQAGYLVLHANGPQPPGHMRRGRRVHVLGLGEILVKYCMGTHGESLSLDYGEMKLRKGSIGSGRPVLWQAT